MADFGEALLPVLAHEGGYVHDPADAGGETYRGISRRYHPDWTGWAVIDASRRAGQGIPDGILQDLVARHYRIHYWDRFQGDRIQDQGVAGELMDQAVHLGVHRAVSHLQRALNACNDQGRRWADMGVDGELGPRTLAALEAATARGLARTLAVAMNCQQGVYYLERMEARPANERFLGWFQRVR